MLPTLNSNAESTFSIIVKPPTIGIFIILITSAAPIVIKLTAVIVTEKKGYIFRNWRYITVQVSLGLISNLQFPIYFNTGCTIFFIDRDFLLK